MQSHVMFSTHSKHQYDSFVQLFNLKVARALRHAHTAKDRDRERRREQQKKINFGPWTVALGVMVSNHAWEKVDP